MARQSKAWVYGLSLTEIEGSNPSGGVDVFSCVNVVWCLVEVPAAG